MTEWMKQKMKSSLNRREILGKQFTPPPQKKQLRKWEKERENNLTKTKVKEGKRNKKEWAT